ncbi:MAG: DNA polymerase, partial [Cyanobacteria bacterium J06553_1]
MDAAHFFGSPGLSMAWFYKLTGARPDVLKDPAMYEMFERGVRGGMTFVNIHEATADSSDPEKRHHLAYIDENNLYGNCMRQMMPYSDFQWLSDKECTNYITNAGLETFDTEGELGFLAEVDLEYPPEVQDTTLDLPLAPEAGSIHEEQLSPYMKHLWVHYYGSRPYHGTQKLLLTHQPKQRYIVHSRALVYYVQRGLRITHCHRCIFFQQRAFMKDYVDYHTAQRSQATTASKKNLHKYMVNSLFGKTMEDVRRHQQRRVTHSPSILFRNASSPLCEAVMPIGEETVVVTMRKTSVLLNKPIFIGQCILDTSKIIMYRLLNQLKEHPVLSKVELIGGDTDSFFLRFQSPLPLEDVWRSMPNFDSSNYPPTHPLHSNTNKARLGCFKDEACGRHITSFVALSPKMYSFVVDNDTSQLNNKVKG